MSFQESFDKIIPRPGMTPDQLPDEAWEDED